MELCGVQDTVTFNMGSNSLALGHELTSCTCYVAHFTAFLLKEKVMTIAYKVLRLFGKCRVLV